MYNKSYLSWHDREADGWPTGFDPSEKLWFTDQITDFMKRMKDANPTNYSVTLTQVYDWIKHEPDQPEAFKEASLLDFRYAVIHRALIQVATETWTLGHV